MILDEEIYCFTAKLVHYKYLSSTGSIFRHFILVK